MQLLFISIVISDANLQPILMYMGPLLQGHGLHKSSSCLSDYQVLISCDFTACNTLRNCDQAAGQQQNRVQSGDAVSFDPTQCHPLSRVACLCHSFCLLVSPQRKAHQQLEQLTCLLQSMTMLLPQSWL